MFATLTVLERALVVGGVAAILIGISLWLTHKWRKRDKPKP